MSYQNQNQEQNQRMNKQISRIKNKELEIKYQKIKQSHNELTEWNKTQDQIVKDLREENQYLQGKNAQLNHVNNDLHIKVDCLNDNLRSATSKLENMNEQYQYEKQDNRELLEDLQRLKYRNKQRVNNIVEKFKVIDNFKNESCSICLEVSGEKIVTDCGHTFHKECLSKVRNDSCPMCRSKISYNLFKFNSNPIDFEYSIV